MTATMTPSDAAPDQWELENAFGRWEALLSEPDELDERAAALRAGGGIDERDTYLENLIGRLDQLLGDPDLLEARAAAMRAAAAEIEAADQQFKVDKAKWGKAGAAFMAGDADALAPSDEDERFYKVSHVAGLQRWADQLTELVKGLGDFRHNQLCDDCDARLYSHLKAAFAAMRAEQA